MHYKIKIKPEARLDIQEGIDWYNSRQPGLGKRFHTAVKQEFKLLQKSPLFQTRYDDIRCLPMKKFPYMLHFTTDQEKKQIIVFGVINTYKNPAGWPGKK